MEKKYFNQHLLKEQANFYNQNYDVFKSIEDNYKLDIWFLVHFRIYFSVRNQLQDSTNNPYSNGDTDLFGIVRFLFFFLRNAFKLRRKNNTRSSICVVSSGHKVKDIHVGSLRGIGYNLFLLNIPKFSGKYNHSKILDTHDFNYFNNSYWILLRGIINIRNWRILFGLNNDLKRKFDQLVFESSNEQKFLMHLKKLRISILFKYLEYLTYKLYFEKSGFRAVVMYDENSPSKRVIWQAASQVGIKTFAIQHGATHSLNPAYNYANYDCPPQFCDVTFLWGSFYEKQLLGYGYKYEKLNIQGPIPIDSIDSVGLEQKKLTWLRKFNPTNKEVICYCSQPQKDESLRLQQLKDVVEVMIGLPNYLLIIRPHPNESLSYFYDYFKQHNINTSSIILEKEVELELHFLVSNILITSFSTVGIEFSKYYKPIVILDYLKEDLLDYISSGIGIAVTNKQELQELFNNKSRLAINNQNFTKFLAKYYFQPKKTVSEGILSVIKSSV